MNPANEHVTDRELIITDCPLVDPSRLLQLTPRNTEPVVSEHIGNHHIRTTTQFIDGVVRMTMTDFCCDVEVSNEQTLTELIVGRVPRKRAATGARVNFGIDPVEAPIRPKL